MAENNNLGELLPIRENNGQRAVNARNLHEFLQIGKDFSTWVKVQFDRCDLTENIDFQVITQKGENPNGGRPTIEYALSISAAKEISMMSQTDRGKQARRYFIACEEKLQQISRPSYQIENPIERAEKWIEEEKVRQQLQIENKKQKEQIDVQNEQISEMSEAIMEMKAKTEYLDIILKCKGTVTVTQIAQDYGMSAKKFNTLLRNKGIQHKVNGQWILYGKYIAKGYVHSKPVDITHKDGRKDVAYNTEWTQRGRLFIYETLKKDSIVPIIERN